MESDQVTLTHNTSTRPQPNTRQVAVRWQGLATEGGTSTHTAAEAKPVARGGGEDGGGRVPRRRRRGGHRLLAHAAASERLGDATKASAASGVTPTPGSREPTTRCVLWVWRCGPVATGSDLCCDL